MDRARKALPLLNKVKSINKNSPQIGKAIKSFADKLWKPQAGPQTQAFNHQADELLFGGAAGGGKAQPCYSIEWAFENLKSFTVDQYSSVLSQIPQEIRNKDSKILMGDGRWKSLAEIVVGDRIMNPSGRTQEVLQVHERGILHLYRITFADKTTVECSGDHLWGFWNIRPPTVKTIDWGVSYIYNTRVKNTEWLFEQFNQWGKFAIPINDALNYTDKSLNSRWEIARRLFDAHGEITQDNVFIGTFGDDCDFVTDLVRSLGYMVRHEEIDSDRTKLVVEGNDKWKLFSLPCKVEAAKEHEPNIWVGKRIENIEEIGSTYCRCITVSNPNGLYITDGYNVTHNSALLLILAGLSHTQSIIFRREYSRLKDIIEKSRRMFGELGKSARYNSTDKIWRLPSGKTIEFGAIQYDQDMENYRGREHDLKGWDELTEFTQEIYEFVNTWNRSPNQVQRCRIVATCNPPSTEEGQWIIDYWGPWLKEDYEGVPALPGEIRWFARIGDKDVELESGDRFSHTDEDGRTEQIIPRSRSFIPARLEDNAYLMNTNYRGALQRLPEPLRSQLLYGSFKKIKTKDHPWQVIPSEWYDQAVARWTENPPAPQSHLGVDVARGGECNSVIASRYYNWLAPLIVIPGTETPDGDTLAMEILKHRRHNKVEIRIDVLGVGYSPYDSLNRLRVKEVVAINGNASTGEKKDKSGVLEFFNLRSFMYWHFREALDPKNHYDIMLPNDPRLRREILAPRWECTKGRSDFGIIRVESKEDIIKRIGGGSPDRADATVYAFADLELDVTDNYDWLRG